MAQVPVANAGLPGRWGGGLLLGYAKPSGMSIGNQIGLELNGPITGLLSGMAFYTKTSQTVSLTSDSNQVDASADLSLMGLGVSYHLNPKISAGLKMGIAKYQTDILATDGASTVRITDSSSGLFVEPMLLYEVPSSANWSLGAELGYVLSLKSAVPGELTFMGCFKYWY